jgi:hypothetical protein
MSSRKDQKEALRAERQRREEEASATERRKRVVGIGAAAVLVVAAIAAIAVVVLTSGGGDKQSGRAAEPSASEVTPVALPPGKATNLEEAAKAASCEFKTHPPEGRNHVNGHVDYKTNPPSSGNHNEFPAEDGFYTPDGAPTVEQLVHSLEHGRVIFWYQPNASPQLLGQLKALQDEDNYHVIVAPNPRKMPAQIAASSWTRTITCPQVNDKTWDALRLFRDRYRDQAPERVA